MAFALEDVEPVTCERLQCVYDIHDQSEGEIRIVLKCYCLVKIR